jgi:hypothetical protein
MRKQRPDREERLASASRATVAIFICFMIGNYARSRGRDFRLVWVQCLVIYEIAVNRLLAFFPLRCPAEKLSSQIALKVPCSKI